MRPRWSIGLKRAANPHLGRRRIGAYSLWDQPGAYLGDFLARASADWHHSEWDFRKIIAAGVAKVHLDALFTRYRSDKHSTRFDALLHDRMPVCSGAVVAEFTFGLLHRRERRTSFGTIDRC